MPLKLEPNQTFEVFLEIDKDKPKESRPVFMATVQSVRGQRKISETVDAWRDPEYFKTANDLYDTAVELLKSLIVDWRNMGQPYDADKIEDVLTYLEIRELIQLVQYGPRHE